MIRDTSQSAIDGLNATGRASLLRNIIHKCVVMSSVPLTRKAIADKTGLPINTVAGRCNELLKIGMLAELPAIRDPETGRHAHPVTASVRVVHCKNCNATLYAPRDIEPPVLGFICSDQCERENAEHYA